MATTRQIPLSHPGEILLKRFLQPLGVSQTRLAEDRGGSVFLNNDPPFLGGLAAG